MHWGDVMAEQSTVQLGVHEVEVATRKDDGSVEWHFGDDYEIDQRGVTLIHKKDGVIIEREYFDSWSVRCIMWKTDYSETEGKGSTDGEAV